MQVGKNQEIQITKSLECILNQVDPQFDATLGHAYRLSTLMCREGFSFLVTDTASKKVMKLSSYRLSETDIKLGDAVKWPESGSDYFEQLIKTDFAQLSCSRTDIAIATNRITVAPHDFIEQGAISDIMSAAFSYTSEEEILTDPVSGSGPVVAMLAPRYISSLCAALFPGVSLHSAAAVFVKAALLQHSQLSSRQVFVNVYREHFEIALIQGARLLFLNAFRYSSSSDVLYYVIFVLEQLGFVPSEENLILMGEVSENSVIYQQLKMYCASIQYVTPPDGIELGNSFSGIPVHTYFTLLNVSLCE